MREKIEDVDKKIPDLSGLVTTTVFDTKISEIENKIRGTRGLVNTIVLNTKTGLVEDKILDVSTLVRKTDYNTKISDTEEKYFAASDYNKITSEIYYAKINEKRLVGKPSIYNLVENLI